MIWLAGQIAVFIAAAAVIGFTGGWMIRTRVEPVYSPGTPEAFIAELETELDANHSELQAAKRAADSVPELKLELGAQAARIVELESMLSGAGSFETQTAAVRAEISSAPPDQSATRIPRPDA